MKLEPVALMLELANVGTRGKHIFVGHMPAERDGILLRQPYGGSPLDHELPGWIQTTFQLVVRGNDFKATEQKILHASQALTVVEADRSTVFFRYMRPKHLPLNYPLSPGNRFEFLVNFEACYVDTDLNEVAPVPQPL